MVSPVEAALARALTEWDRSRVDSAQALQSDRQDARTGCGVRQLANLFKETHLGGEASNKCAS